MNISQQQSPLTHPVEHSDTRGHLTISSLDTYKTLTWVTQRVVTATDWAVGRMNKDESRGDPKDGLETEDYLIKIRLSRRSRSQGSPWL